MFNKLNIIYILSIFDEYGVYMGWHIFATYWDPYPTNRQTSNWDLELDVCLSGFLDPTLAVEKDGGCGGLDLRWPQDGDGDLARTNAETCGFNA